MRTTKPARSAQAKVDPTVVALVQAQLPQPGDVKKYYLNHERPQAKPILVDVEIASVCEWGWYHVRFPHLGGAAGVVRLEHLASVIAPQSEQGGGR